IKIEHLPKQIIEDESNMKSSFFAIEEKTPYNQQDVTFIEYVDTWQKEIKRIWNEEEIIPLEEVLASIKSLEKFIGSAYIEKALQHTIGNRKEAANLLVITDRRLIYFVT